MNFPVTSILLFCYVVVLETRIIRIYFISLIQSHKYVSCKNFMWAVLIPPCDYSYCSARTVYRFTGFSWHTSKVSSLRNTQNRKEIFIKVALKDNGIFLLMYMWVPQSTPRCTFNWLPANTVKSYFKGNPVMD